jgi:hypothetical protein
MTFENITSSSKRKPTISEIFDEFQKTAIMKPLFLYVPVTDKSYQKILIDIFKPEGGDPEIESVFFFNLCEKNKKKLIIICSWQQVH